MTAHVPLPLEPAFETPPPYRHFFGYYDKSALDRAGTRLLCHRTDFDGRLVGPEDVAEIGTFDLSGGAFRKLGETRAFNWQQGSMLQWLGPDFERRIAFNDREGDGFVVRIVDTADGRTHTVPGTVYTVHPNGRSALTVDFERHYYPRRAYAYAGIERPEKDRSVVPGDGVFRLDLEGGGSTRVADLADLLATRPLSSMQGAVHYVEHLMFAPSGARFAFYHRWETADGGIYTRLYTAAPDGSDRRLVLDSGKVTHCCWRDDATLLAWSAPPSAATRLRRRRGLVKGVLRPLQPAYQAVIRQWPRVRRVVAGQSYLLLADAEDAVPERFAPERLTADGHPSFRPDDPDVLVTDTYPQADGRQRLLLYDAREDRRLELAALRSLPDHDETGWRCDLHPRWDLGGRSVSVDTLDAGSRQVRLYDLAAAGLVPEPRTEPARAPAAGA